MRTEDLIFSSLMTNEEYARKVLPHVKEDYFSSTADKTLFKLYSDYFQNYNAIPSKQALLVEVEGLRANASTYKEVKTLVSQQEEFKEKVEFLVKKTETFCKERALYNAIKESVLIADDKTSAKSVDAIPSILQEALSVCFDTSVGHSYVDDAADRYEYYHKKEAKIPTGVQMLDYVTKGGFSRKTLNMFLAPPHGGKSLFMVNCAIGALNAAMNVLYITMEMAEEEIARRFDVNFLNIEMDELDIIPKSTFEGKFNNLRKKAMGKLVIKQFPTGGAHVGHFKTLIEELRTKQNFVPDLIVIDYLNICQSQKYKNNASANSYTTVMSIGQELRGLAIELNCAILSATQTTRGGAASSDVDMTSVSESFGINAICDSMFAIIDSDELKGLHQIMLKQLKNRYRDLNLDNRFVVGINRAKMKLFDVDQKNGGQQRQQPSSNTSYSRPAPPPAQKSNNDGFDDFNF